MLKNYELLYILHPDLEGSSDKISEKVAGFISKVGGEVTSQEEWGKRKLTYKINKNDFGVYVLVNFTLPSENLPSVENDLRLSEEIMRSMIVVLPEVIESKADAKAKKTTKSKAETPKSKSSDSAKATKDKKDEATEEKAEEVKKPAKTKKAEEAKVETEEPSDSAEALTDKKAKKATKKAEPEVAEEERLKKLDEKLEEILGE